MVKLIQYLAYKYIYIYIRNLICLQVLTIVIINNYYTYLARTS